MILTYLRTTELALRIKYEPKTIKDSLVEKVLIEGEYFQLNRQWRTCLISSTVMNEVQFWNHLLTDEQGHIRERL